MTLKTLSQAEVCLMRSFLLGGGPGGVNAMLLAKAAQKRSGSLARDGKGYMRAMLTEANSRKNLSLHMILPTTGVVIYVL